MKGNTIKVVVGLVVSLLIALPLLGACRSAPPETAKKTILVGYIGDFSGPTATASGRLWTCAREFFKWANETNYLPGVKIEWTEEDDRFDPGEVPLAYRRMMDKNPTVLFAMTAMTAIISKPLADRDKIPVIAFTGSVATAQEPPSFIFVGSLVPEISFNCFLNYVADTWTEERPCCIASLGWDTEDGRQHIESGIATAEALDIDFKRDYAEIAPIGTMDFSAYVTRLKELNPDYIYLEGIAGGASGSAVKTAVAMGMDPKKFVYTISSGGGMYEELISVCGQENTVGAMLVMADYPYSIITEDQERIKAFMEGTDYGWDPRYHVNALSFYFSCKVLYEGLRIAIEDVGIENLDREALYKALRKIKNFDTGVSLPVTYGTDDRLAVQSVQIYKWQEDGIPYLVTDKVYNWPQKWGPDVY